MHLVGAEPLAQRAGELRGELRGVAGSRRGAGEALERRSGGVRPGV
jgi:hypothetical protein